MKEIKEKLEEYYNKINTIFDGENTAPKLTKKHNRFKRKEEQELVTGVIVISLIIIILISTIYYFLVFMPEQEELNNIKQEKINSVNSLLIHEDNQNREAIISQIESAATTEELNSLNIENMVYPILKNNLLEQVQEYKDKYNRIEVTTDNTTDIMNTDNATNYIKSQDASTLSVMSIKQVDSVIIPLSINRKQAASGFITQGDTVDIYKNSQNRDENSEDFNENQSEENVTVGSHHPNKIVGGSTVVSILRSKDSGSIEENIEISQSPKNRNISQTSSLNIQEILSSKAAGTYDEKQIKILLENYGMRLANYERTSNIGDLDVEYIIMLEVPRESVETLIENMDNIILTIPTYDSPSWVKL
ncbi:MAG: hypothetical protein BZ138_04010 [Methanosphaera sp. rholeuAM270]|nr:MAG: hypothetical protein BZ138_04010 [Methanosphaera sp. rholeuAM270]